MFDTSFISFLQEDGYGDHWDASMETANDPLPDHDLLAEDLLPSPIDDHQTYGGTELLSNNFIKF